jgi:hypothetical protein
MSVLRLLAATLAFAAAATIAGCSHDDIRYPSGWAPVANANGPCPDLAGTWRVDGQPGDPTGGIGVLAMLGQEGGLHAAPVFALVNSRPWTGIEIEREPPHALKLKFHRQRPDSAMGGVMIPVHADLDPAACDGGMVTIAHRDTAGGSITFRLGTTTAGELVAERLADEPLPLLRWGDTPLLMGGRGKRATWGRWQPVAPQDSTAAPVPTRSPATVARPVGSLFAAVPSAFKTPALPIPPAPPTRPGALPFGEAQAIVLSALPDSALFVGMTPTPRGYSLRVSTPDPQAIAQLAQRLASDGHFEANAGAGAATGDVTLELVERGLR